MTAQNATQVKEWLDRLDEAVKNKRKKAILEVYSVFEEHDFSWDKYPNHFKRFDKLVDRGNDVLYS